MPTASFWLQIEKHRVERLHLFSQGVLIAVWGEGSVDVGSTSHDDLVGRACAMGDAGLFVDKPGGMAIASFSGEFGSNLKFAVRGGEIRAADLGHGEGGMGDRGPLLKTAPIVRL